MSTKRTFSICFLVTEDSLGDFISLGMEMGQLLELRASGTEEPKTRVVQVRGPNKARLVRAHETLIRTAVKAPVFGNTLQGIAWGLYNVQSEGGRKPLTVEELRNSIVKSGKLTPNQAMTTVSAFIHQLKLLAPKESISQ